jgi:predicted nucleic acid-binding protein
LKPILVDTGFLIALFNEDDRNHAACAGAHDRLDQPLATCEAVIAETCYMLRRFQGAAEVIMSNIEAGIFEIPFQINRSAAKVQAILDKYRDTPASFADACLVQMADELDTGDILTLDSDFKRYRWRRNRPFHLLIPLK